MFDEEAAVELKGNMLGYFSPKRLNKINRNTTVVRAIPC